MIFVSLVVALISLTALLTTMAYNLRKYPLEVYDHEFQPVTRVQTIQEMNHLLWKAFGDSSSRPVDWNGYEP